MKNRTQSIPWLMSCAVMLFATPLFAADIAQLQRAFDKPPDDARIMVRWWWFGPAVTQPELEREMKIMKEGGIGGFEVQPTYPLALDDELPGLKNLKFMSPEFLDALKFTAAKAKEIGLRMDLTLGSGWPYGGPMFTRQEAVGALRASAPVHVSTGQTTVAMPAGGGGRGGDIGEIVAVLLGPVANAPAGESPYLLLEVRGNEAILPSDLRGANQVTFYTLGLPGLVYVKRPAYGADGYIIDHYSPTVIDHFIKEIAEPEIAACGPNPPYAIFCDSLEVAGENWTPNFLAEFKKRRGYDLTPLLPSLFNDSSPKAMDIRHDWGQTVTEIFNDYFNTTFQKLAKAHNTRYRIQGYGTPPAALYSYASTDLPEGEGYQWKGFSTTRWAASASHLLGKPVTSSETFTWLHSPVFRATPLDMKAEADMHFLCGINQIICHGWPYTAEGVGYPGWSFYAAAVFNEKNPWWIVMPDVTKYLQRVSSILRQGTPASDVAVFLPNSDGWASFSGRNFSMSAAMQAKVSSTVKALTDSNYNPDFFDDQLLEMRGKVDGNALAFGDVRYRVVVLPSVERILPATMKKLEALARAGGIIVATKRLPDLAPGYKATDEDTRTVHDIAQRLFKDPNAPGIFVEDEAQFGEAISKRFAPGAAMSPASPEIGVVHRHTDGGEVYFIANTGNQPKNVKATFRVAGMHAEIWNPVDGRISPAQITEKSARATSVNLNLEPYGSTIIVFTKRTLRSPKPAAVASLPAPVDLSTGWTVRFGNDAQGVAMDKLASWTTLEGKTNFSGTATYEKTITIAPELLKPRLSLSFNFGSSTPVESAGGGRGGGMGYRALLDPPVREAAIVYINDKRVGSLWCPPYSLDVTGKLKAGENKIRIEVANLAINYMASIKFPNYNYDGVTQKYGNRFQPQNLNLVQPLPSGLMGPIQLVATPQANR